MLLFDKFNSTMLQVGHNARGTWILLYDRSRANKLVQTLCGKTVSLFRERFIACTVSKVSSMFCARASVMFCFTNFACKADKT